MTIVTGEKEYDAVIVGARCAGSSLAIALAERGWDVLVVDRDTFPSETVSTHFCFPNTVARFEQLGVLDTLRAAHEVPLLEWRISGLGHDTAGKFTPIDGFDRAMGPRRSALDKAIVDTALAAGAEGRFGERVVELIGSGTDEDPVAGVVLESGERIGARWVFGADGRGSTVAGRLGVEKERPQQGEISFLFAYWAGIPDNGYGTLDIREDAMISRWAVEDGLHLLVATGDAEFTRGTKEERARSYLEVLRRFPETIPTRRSRSRRDGQRSDRRPGVVDARLLPDPEWSRLGAARRRLPLQASRHRSGNRRRGRAGDLHRGGSYRLRIPSLAGYEQWRDARAAEHYDWSFSWGRFPDPSRRTCSGAGQRSQTPDRTSATPSAAWWSPPRW